MVSLNDMNVVQLDILSPFINIQSILTRQKQHYRAEYLELVYPKKSYTSHSVYTFKKLLNGVEHYGHHTVIFNPKGMLSVLEPLKRGGCSFRLKNTVIESSRQKECMVAVNGGFFNDRSGECYGNVISDGNIVNTFNGKKSAGFGIREDGGIVVGYFFESDIYENNLVQLISGIGWILKNGKSFVDDSFQDEKCNLNNADAFFHSKSSRTFIGHDSEGFVHIVQVDGKTLENGYVQL